MKTKTLISTLAVGVALAAATPAQAAPTVSYLFGRTMVAQGTGRTCAPIAGADTIYQAADALAARGVAATAVSTVNLTGEVGRVCQGGLLYADWQDLTTLHDLYGWSAVSRGMTGADITAMTKAGMTSEACGSLAAFASHGLDASAEYAYAGNAQNVTAQGVVGSCFTYGRAYGTTSVPLPVKAPYNARAASVTGGACWDASLPCYAMAMKNDRRYILPSTLVALEQLDGWSQIQWYRLVSGTYGSVSGTGPAWDCTSTDPRQHWTRNPEVYCFDDMLAVVDGRPAGGQVLSPAQVAASYGRVPAPVAR